MMRTGIPKMLLGAALLSSVLSLGGCKQNEGERCQIDDDCSTGLICVLIGSTRDVGGYCKSTTPTAIDLATTPVDMATSVDLTTTPPDLLGRD
jgi:hypothetical protein